MLMESTFATLSAPYDDIVMRVGWAFQDWHYILEEQQQQTHGTPVLIIVAALYMALSDALSSLLPESAYKYTNSSHPPR
jgi:hypothetical protein